MRALAVLTVLGAATYGAGMLLLDGSGSPRTAELSLPEAAPEDDPLEAAPASGLEIPSPRLLQAEEEVSLWAPVLRAVAVRSSPSRDAAALGRLPVRTPEETTNIVLVTGPGRRSGSLWIPIRGAGVTGWVPRDALGGYESVDTRLRVDTRALTATLLSAGRIVFHAQIGVGTDAAPTPTGRFYIRNKLTRYRSAAYGPIAFGTSARSETQTDWPAGGFVGIHGTDRPELLPGRVSHGCIRMRNDDIETLARLMPIGTPVTIT